MGNFKRLGNFEEQTEEKKEASLVGEGPKQPVFDFYKEGFFWP
jgi:hypothetical protein